MYPNQITEWKKQAMQGLPQIFSDRRAQAQKSEKELKAALYQ